MPCLKNPRRILLVLAKGDGMLMRFLPSSYQSVAAAPEQMTKRLCLLVMDVRAAPYSRSRLRHLMLDQEYASNKHVVHRKEIGHDMNSCMHRPPIN
ncbi:hypothetical protein CY34DRAFT_126639 [Suillus luteus UH-Slu-Lm8-n1]|uniref:Uncharacterized protein n=1 Tax=Suillus luteus UH-Slu-Lm8-n1 TaxID=930992 RepID=A0A0D0BQU1_9AGAM|nr:hypothetical protein CY34DRAFT_126639 [Suillus luteus UH-Slu-Lm8-n1]